MESAIDRRRPNDLFSFISKSSVGFLLICAFFISGAFAQSESGSAAIEGTIRRAEKTRGDNNRTVPLTTR